MDTILDCDLKCKFLILLLLAPLDTNSYLIQYFSCRRDFKQSFYPGLHRKTADKVIIKEFHINYYPENDTSILNEILLLSQISHVALPKLKECFMTDRSIFMILDYIPPMTLLTNYIDSLSIFQIRSIMNQLFDVVYYCHEYHHIVLRDLNPRNISIQIMKIKRSKPSSITAEEEEEEEVIVKLLDFTFAVTMTDNRRNNEELSLLSDHILFDWYLVKYSASEIVLSKRYNVQADMWSLGVILYEMLSNGEHPFDHSQDHILLQKIAKAEYPRNKLNNNNNIDEEGIFLIESLLKVSPHDRLTASYCFNHLWMDHEHF
jgi:serine/threonine protein kinase